MKFNEAWNNLMPGDMVYVFKARIEDRHLIEAVYLVKKCHSDDSITVERPDGTSIRMHSSQASKNDVLIISDSSLVAYDHEKHAWRYKNSV